MKVTTEELARMLGLNPDISVDGLPHPEGSRQPVSAAPQAAKMTEHDLQCQVISECRRRALRDPRYTNIFAIPNGGHRYLSVAAKLKAEGVQAGIPDLFLPVPSRGLHGMWLELKVGKNRPSLSQLDWMGKLRAQGYHCVVVHDSVEDVMRHLEWYLSP